MNVGLTSPPVQMRKDNSDYEHNGRFNQNMLNI